MAQQLPTNTIYNSKLWITKDFDHVLLRSKLGYSDGTRGVSTIPISIRPAAFGAATFEFSFEEGIPVFSNIQGLGGEVPGDQTVPRAEAWAATVLMTRIHPNGVARLGIDASYVTNGAHNRTRLEKGMNGDLWGLFFALLDLRSSEVDCHKVSSHIEGVGLKAVEWGHAELIDLIGNALADEAAELTAKLLRPSTEANKQANELDKLAFNICVRIGFIQARLWDLFGNAPIHDAPTVNDEAPITNQAALEALIGEMKKNGHVLERKLRGPRGAQIAAELDFDPNKSREENRQAASQAIRSQAGLFWTICQKFRRQEGFRKLSKPCVPIQKPENLVT